MVASSIIYAPTGIQAAYRPIFIQVQASVYCPPNQPMYCDVYWYNHLSDVYVSYYRTIIAYPVPQIGTGSASVYNFDIQDVVQEMLQTYLVSSIPNGSIIQASDIADGGTNTYNMIRVLAGFRGSTFDSNGLLVPNATVPIAGTATTNPTNGTYEVSSILTVLKASLRSPQYVQALQAELEQYWYNNPDLAHIYTLSRLPGNPVTPDGSTYPLFGNALKVYRQDTGVIPLLVWSFRSGTQETMKLAVKFIANQDTSTIYIATVQSGYIMQSNTYYIPCGIADLIGFMSSGLQDTFLDPSNEVYYWLELIHTSGNNTAWVSPLFQVCSSTPETVRLYFQNSFGHMECVTFERNSQAFNTKGNDMFIPYEENSNTGTGLIPLTGHKKYNVRAFDEYTLVGNFPEVLMDWLKDFMQSVFIQMQYQDPIAGLSLMTVTIADGSWATKKSIIEGRINYEVSFKIRPALDYIPLRN
jgi:hypothetical protein